VIGKGEKIAMRFDHHGNPVQVLMRWAVALAVVFATTVPATRIARADDDDHAEKWATGTPDFEWAGALKAGQRVVIKGVNGRIIAGATTSDKVEIRAWKHGRHSDPAEVKIEMVPDKDGVTVCALYPAPFGSSPNTCEAGDDSHSHVNNNDVEVRFVVRVPAGVGFSAHNVNGGVTAVGLTGAVSASTVNGSVDIVTSGRAQASTVNGSIRAALGAANWSDPVKFETVNGGISLSVPTNLNADVECSTVNGSIESDLPWLVHGKIGRTHMQGTFNKGGSPLKIATVNGSIEIRSGT
jgi:hypothetical protein